MLGHACREKEKTRLSSEMDIKKLISEVQNRPEIWDPKHCQYHHRTRIVEIWTEISQIVGFSSKFC
jgi:hypothetical protein